MGEFQLWYAYYDALFLHEKLTLPLDFLLQHTLIDAEWKNSVCPPLSDFFIVMESFIRDESNFQSSSCSKEELLAIQEDLNILLYFIQIQKRYCSEFWKKSPRRVQASLTHFYSLLQFLIKSFLPFSTMSIMDCRQINKFCIKLKKLENLFNYFNKNIQDVVNYFNGDVYSEQRSLLQNIFDNMIVFLREAPKIKKNKLCHIHQLTKYINYSNPIQIDEELTSTRKKSRTIGNKQDLLQFQKEESIASNYSDQTIANRGKYFEGSPVKERKRRKSQTDIVTREKIVLNGSKSPIKLPKLFKFNEKFYQADSKQRNHSFCSVNSLAAKAHRLRDTKRNISIKMEDRSLSKKRQQTMISTQPSKTSFRKSNLKKKGYNFYEDEEQRYEDTKSIFFQKKEKNYLIIAKETKVESRGWKILREYFWKRVMDRKLSKLTQIN